MNTEFSDQREHSARKTPLTQAESAPRSREKRVSAEEARDWIAASSLGLLFYTDPLWCLRAELGRQLGPLKAPTHGRQDSGAGVCGSKGLGWLTWHLFSGLAPQQKAPGDGMVSGTWQSLRTLGGGWHGCLGCWQDILVGIQSMLKDIYFYFKWKGWVRWLLGLFQPSYSAFPWVTEANLVTVIQHLLVLFALSFLATKVKSPNFCAKYLTLIMDSLYYCQ